MAADRDSRSRDTILDAAERLFARQGFAATTIKQIGAAAGVNSALLYYYFADKETLYRAMLRRVLERFAAIGDTTLADPITPEDGIRALVRAQADVLRSGPHVARLVARELVDNEARHAEEGIARLAAGTFRRLRELIERGQRAGRFRRDLDARHAAISIVSQVVYFHVARPAVGVLLGHGPQGAPPETAHAFAEHAADFALAALRAPERAARRPRRAAVPDDAAPSARRATPERRVPRGASGRARGSP